VRSSVKTIVLSICALVCLCFFLLICLMLVWGVVARSTAMGKPSEIPYSELLDKIDAGQVQDATIQGTDLHGHFKGQRDDFHTTIPANDQGLQKAMLAAGVTFSIKAPQINLAWAVLCNVGPLALLFLFILPPFWMVFKKAGFSPWLAVLMLVPLVNIVTFYVVAFSKWRKEPPASA